MFYSIFFLNITNEIGAVQLIEGGAGNDLLLGSESGNRIIGGLGSDFIVSGSGNDILEGEIKKGFNRYVQNGYN